MPGTALGKASNSPRRPLCHLPWLHPSAACGHARWLQALAPDEIDAFIASGEWRGKAGGYAVQGRTAAFVRFVNGSYNNVVGLPLYETVQLLRGLGLAG